MAVTLVGTPTAGFLGATSGFGPVTLTVPAGTASGDVMFLHVVQLNNIFSPSSGFGLVTAGLPAGWARLGTRLYDDATHQSPAINGMWQELWWKRNAGETTVAVTVTGPGASTSQPVRFYGTSWRGAAGSPAGVTQSNQHFTADPSPHMDATIIVVDCHYALPSGITYHGFSGATGQNNTLGFVTINVETSGKDVTGGAATTMPTDNGYAPWHACYLPWVPISRGGLRLGLSMGQRGGLR